MALEGGELIGVVTAIYIGLGVLLSIYPPYIADKALGRICIFTCSVCLWLLWLVCYLSQLNPMEAPEPMPLESD
ncbi:hypothetical protein CYY_009002 [Polysphondylium violaceum]|uniref:Uncharacterized protein n=1 Tax=Polysphondylium violaceum TaxID=133409 RepID=A0A8J4PMN3_9MYCE|nr:hypothetical protein CYY_009002 [Polysphondylium violaceum]